jgi:hypothetical protein
MRACPQNRIHLEIKKEGHASRVESIQPPHLKAAKRGNRPVDQAG